MKRIAILFCLKLLFISGLSAQQAEYGLASYYSDFFQGKPTASGELYDNTKLTGAHKTLPFGTLVKVTRTDNKKSVQIRINDRGPFISGRIIELSREAASRVDLIADGSASVKVEVLSEKAAGNNKISEVETGKPTSFEEKAAPVDNNKGITSESKAAEASRRKEEPKKTTPPATKTAKSADDAKRTVNKNPEKSARAQPDKDNKSAAAKPAVLVKGKDYQTYDLFELELKRPEKKGYGVQIASLSSQDALFRKLAELQEDWFSKILVSVQQGTKNETLYRVILGSFATENEAASYRDNLKKNKKLSGFVVNLADLNKE